MNHNELLAAVESVIETSVRPQLQAHGGDVKLLSIEAGICRVKLLGQCSGCPFGIYYNRGDYSRRNCQGAAGGKGCGSCH